MATPLPSDVRAGVAYVDSDDVAQVGTLIVPDPAEVLLDVAYGAGGVEFVGSLAAHTSDTWVTTQNGIIKSPLFLNTDYLVSLGNGFRFRVLAPQDVNLEDVELHFKGRAPCQSAYAWDSVAVSAVSVTVDGVEYWDCFFDLLAAQTVVLAEARYYWWVTMETLTADVVLKHHPDNIPLYLLRA